MSLTEPFGQHGRLLAIALLLVALSGLFVWYGMLSYEPAINDFPDEDNVGPNPDAYVGERVVLGGEITATDPITIEATHCDGTTTFVLENADATLQNADGPLEVGDSVSAFGTLETTATLDTERTVTHEVWEYLYMYAISFLGGVWVLGRFVQGWRFDCERLAFTPRERRLTVNDLGRSPTHRDADASRDSGDQVTYSSQTEPSKPEDDPAPRREDEPPIGGKQ